MNHAFKMNVNIDNVTKQIKQLLDDGVVTQSSVARESGVSKTAVNQFLKGAYPGDNQKLTRDLEAWLEFRQQKSQAMPEVPGFVETSTVKQIWSTLQYAQIASSISIIFGNPGVSKTQAIRQYQKNNNNVWLVTISPSRNSVLECLYEIALELDIRNAPRRSGPLARMIVNKLEDTQGLVIIDEADQLTHDALEEIRSIQERAEIGFALVGNHQVYSNLTGGKRDVDFARLFSRVAKKLVINKVKKYDIRDVADAWGLVNKPERDMVEQIAAKPGGLRTLFQTLKLAALIARGNGEAIDVKHIKCAFADLEGVNDAG
jgi:DNA transposition AAA+ family ATPase